MKPDVDVVIVGGGPAGAATALFAAAAEPRLRLVVIDRARFPRDKVCAGAIGARADRALASIGVSVAVPSAEVLGLSVKARSGQLVERMPFPIGRVVRRFAYDAALLDQVRARGIEVRDGVAFSGMQRRDGDVLVDTSAGTLSACAVVGADGMQSKVRSALGLGRGDFHAQAVEVDTRWAEGDPPDDVLHFDVCDRSHDGYAWDFPTIVDGCSMVCRGIYQLTRGVDGARGADDVTALLQRRLEERGIDAAGLRFKRFAERGLGLFQPCSVERALLVGEAAGIDPVLGEGIAQAILYGSAVGAYLGRSWREGDWRFAGYRRALRQARVGVDLRIRAALAQLVYGRTRPFVERWVTRSRDLARAGMSYFAGERVPRRWIAGAGVDLWRAL